MSKALKKWIQDIFNDKIWKWRSYADWFDFQDFDSNSLHVWTPPPCIADVCVERLVEAYHIWPDSCHVFVAQALMTSLWRKQLSKAADILFNITAGVEFWPDGMYEPLTLAILCPISLILPFKVKQSININNWKCHMSSLWGKDTSIIRNHMCQLWNKDKFKN